MGRAEFLVYTSNGPEWRPFDLVSIYPSGDGYCYRVPGEPEGWLPEDAVRNAVLHAEDAELPPVDWARCSGVCRSVTLAQDGVLGPALTLAPDGVWVA